MDTSKHERSVPLLCPTCGSDQFAYDDEDENVPVTCAQCGREMPRDELMRENSESLDKHVENMGQDVMKDVQQELTKSLRDAFKGNKDIEFKG